MPARRWQRLSVTIPRQAAEAVANFLIELGSRGVAELACALEDEVEICGFFPPEAPALGPLVRYLEQIRPFFPGARVGPICLSEEHERDWQDAWREHFTAVAVGRRFVIVAPWEKPPPACDRIRLVIEPGMAFGTGHHGSTQATLEAIEALCEGEQIPSRALDLGTGSGILALALSKLGVPEVWASDIDPDALAVARRNLELNGAHEVRLTAAPLAAIAGTFSLVAANILARTLTGLEGTFAVKVRRDGHLIISGFEDDEADQVARAFDPRRWRLQARWRADGWVALCWRRV